jgi:hypothetical protein
MAVVGHEKLSPLTTIVMTMALMVLSSIGLVNGMVGLVTALLAPRGVTHDFLLLAEAFRSRRGH